MFRQVAWLTFKYTPGQHLYEKTAFINQGDAWLNDKATVPRAGIYYTVVNLHSTCNQITLWLRVNGQKILKVKSTSTDTVHSLTRNIGAVIRLAANDTLTVDIDMTVGVSVPVSDCFTVANPSLKGTNFFFGVLLSPDNVDLGRQETRETSNLA